MPLRPPSAAPRAFAGAALLLLGAAWPALAADGAAPKIINGEDASSEVYPESMGVIVQIMGAPYIMCSSTHIAPDVVLLAAHCVDPNVVGGEVEAVGFSRQSDLSAWKDGTNTEWPTDAVMASDWVMKPEWDINNLQVGLADNQDIALVFLEDAHPEIPHAWLPTADEGQQLVEGHAVDTVGWGMIDPNDSMSYGVKHWGSSTADAVAAFEFQVGAATEAVRHCHGDSGGPTFMKVETDATVDYRVVGVTSHTWDETDCQETGGVATRVDYHLDWVDEELRARCEDGSRAWCDFPGIIPPPIPQSAAELKADIDLVGCAALPAGGGAWGLVAAALLAARRRRPR